MRKEQFEKKIYPIEILKAFDPKEKKLNKKKKFKLLRNKKKKKSKEQKEQKKFKRGTAQNKENQLYSNFLKCMLDDAQNKIYKLQFKLRECSEFIKQVEDKFNIGMSKIMVL